MTRETEEAYDAFIAAIDVSVAGRDSNGFDLRWHVACSAEANAGDMIVEKTATDFYAAALLTAEMIVDDWKSYYPQLVIRTA
jgi:hypothetical protein